MIEEGYQELKYLTKTWEFHQSIPKNIKTCVEKQYKRIFRETMHMLDGLDYDEIFDPNIENDI